MRFKVGNKVRVVNPYSSGNFKDGDIITIAEICGNPPLEFYGAISPHDNMMWFLYENEVTPITMGDIIRARNDHELAEMFSDIISDIKNGLVFSDNPNDWLNWLQLTHDDIEQLGFMR